MQPLSRLLGGGDAVAPASLQPATRIHRKDSVKLIFLQVLRSFLIVCFSTVTYTVVRSTAFLLIKCCT